MRPRLLVLFVAIASVFAQAGCSAAAATPTIADAWARPGAAGAETAAYLKITSAPGKADALMSASSPIAAKVEVHEVSTDAEGMTGMHPIDHLDIHADETVELKPGGFHLMIMGLTKELTVGDTIELELVFENAGKITVKAEVRQG
jgi:hypothetical protein